MYWHRTLFGIGVITLSCHPAYQWYQYYLKCDDVMHDTPTFSQLRQFITVLPSENEYRKLYSSLRNTYLLCAVIYPENGFLN